MQRSDDGSCSLMFCPVGTCAGCPLPWQVSLSEWHCRGGMGPETRWRHSDRDRLLFLPPAPFSFGAGHCLPGGLSGPCSHTSTWPARLRPPLPPLSGQREGSPRPPRIIVSQSLSRGQQLLGRPWNRVFSLSSEGFPSLFLPEQGLHVTLFLIVAP